MRPGASDAEAGLEESTEGRPPPKNGGEGSKASEEERASEEGDSPAGLCGLPTPPGLGWAGGVAASVWVGRSVARKGSAGASEPRAACLPACQVQPLQSSRGGGEGGLLKAQPPRVSQAPASREGEAGLGRGRKTAGNWRRGGEAPLKGTGRAGGRGETVGEGEEREGGREGEGPRRGADGTARHLKLALACLLLRMRRVVLFCFFVFGSIQVAPALVDFWIGGRGGEEEGEGRRKKRRRRRIRRRRSESKERRRKKRKSGRRRRKRKRRGRRRSERKYRKEKEEEEEWKEKEEKEKEEKRKEEKREKVQKGEGRGQMEGEGRGGGREEEGGGEARESKERGEGKGEAEVEE